MQGLGSMVATCCSKKMYTWLGNLRHIYHSTTMVYLNHFNCSKERNYLDKIDEMFIDYFDHVMCRPLLL